LTVCQVHTAVGALVQSWWLNGRASPKLIEHIAECIHDTQQDNAKARKSHIKRTRRKLRQIGIKLTQLKRCCWDST
jgi:ribosomal 50S subunit-associated protein YjgA (DUF615 family)